jgi:hypothetical protein
MRAWPARPVAGLVAVLLVVSGCGQPAEPAATGVARATEAPGPLEVEATIEAVEAAPWDRDVAADEGGNVEVLTFRWTPVPDADGYVLRVDGELWWLTMETELGVQRTTELPAGAVGTVEAVRLPEPNPAGTYDPEAITVLAGPSEPVVLPDHLVDPQPIPSRAPDTEDEMLDLTDADGAACAIADHVVRAAEDRRADELTTVVEVVVPVDAVRVVLDDVRDPDLRALVRALVDEVDDELAEEPLVPRAVAAAEAIARHPRCAVHEQR